MRLEYPECDVIPFSSMCFSLVQYHKIKKKMLKPCLTFLLSVDPGCQFTSNINPIPETFARHGLRSDNASVAQAMSFYKAWLYECSSTSNCWN